MIPAPFDYAAPTTVPEALSLLAEHGDEAKVLAGGQSLLPVLRMRLNAPEMLVDLGKLTELVGVTDLGDRLRIGAMTPYYQLLADPLVTAHAGVLVEAIREVADEQVRHRGTIGGALAHADPAGDVGAPVLVLDATLVVTGMDGTERRVPATEFFVDYFTTAVEEGEILTAVEIPKLDGWGCAYEKFVRVSHQWAIVGVAACVRAEGGTIAEARIGLTNMGSTPLRATAVEQALAGRPATEEGIGDICARVGEGTEPPSDLNGDADYRRHLAGVLTRRAVLAAAGA
ncbi:FAD binding domain-containing protein [Georgenia deserti]|uniref:FAD binding domain-containing protein n=1 Tax=Georgenia deserti TaxID=2093781 RepID=A0ABW4L6C2_9MICO